MLVLAPNPFSGWDKRSYAWACACVASEKRTDFSKDDADVNENVYKNSITKKLEQNLALI